MAGLSGFGDLFDTVHGGTAHHGCFYETHCYVRVRVVGGGEM
jgi:hypothetical protein